VAIDYSDGPMAAKGGLIGSKTIDEIPDIFMEKHKINENWRDKSTN
jgi:hypothetical protein